MDKEILKRKAEELRSNGVTCWETCITKKEIIWLYNYMMKITDKDYEGEEDD